MKMYYDKDADLGVVQGQEGGHHRLRLPGARPGPESQGLRRGRGGVRGAGNPNYELAVKYGFKPVSAAEAAAQAQVVQILTQDHVQAKLYENDLKPHMTGQDPALFPRL